MKKSVKKISQAQKAAQRRYDKEKTKMLSVKYTPMDMDDYYNLKKYLEEHPEESTNGLIKDLIHNFLKTKDKDVSTLGVGSNKASSKVEEIKYCYPYIKIKEKNIDYLYKHFGRSDTDELLEAYWERINKQIVSEYGDKFNEWVEHRIKILAENNPKLSTDGKQMELFRLFNIKFPEK